MDPFEFYYNEFAQSSQFDQSVLRSHGISDEVYERVRVAYAHSKPHFETSQYAGQTGCLPAFLLVSIVGIPLWFLLCARAGTKARRPRNAAIFAFRAAAKGDQAYMRFFDSDMRTVTTDLIHTVF